MTTILHFPRKADGIYPPLSVAPEASLLSITSHSGFVYSYALGCLLLGTHVDLRVWP